MRMWLATIDKLQGKLDSALRALQKVRDLSEQLGERKLVAKTELLLGRISLPPEDGTGRQNQRATIAFDHLFAALEIALEIGDRCTAAAAKSDLGALLKSAFGVESRLILAGRDAPGRLQGLENADRDCTGDLLPVLC